MAPTKTDLRIVLRNDALVPPRITAIIHNGLQLLLPPKPKGAKTDADDSRAIVANTTAPPEDQAAARELFHFAHDPDNYQLSTHAQRLVGLKLVSQPGTDGAASSYVHLSPLARVVVLAALSLGEDGKLYLSDPRKRPLQ